MDDQYNKTIEYNGNIYQYDPDGDSFYRVPTKMSAFDKYGWIVTILLLTALALFLEQ